MENRLKGLKMEKKEQKMEEKSVVKRMGKCLWKWKKVKQDNVFKKETFQTDATIKRRKQ